MRFVKIVLLSLLALGDFAIAQNSGGVQRIPELSAHVTDEAGMISAPDRAEIEEALVAFEQERGSQIAVLTVLSTQPEEIEQYSLRVAEQWKLGRKKIDDGVLLVVAKNDRRMRIEVGYGLEGVLPDATAKRIIGDIITPAFKQGKFSTGIKNGVAAIIQVVKGEALPLPLKDDSGDGSLFLVVGFIVLYMILYIFSRPLSDWDRY